MIDRKSVDNARLLYYSLFSKLFCFDYGDDRFKGTKESLILMAKSPLDENSELSLKELISNIDDNYDNLTKEYDNIFHAPPNPVRATISYYDEGYETGLACVKIKRILAKTNIRRDKTKYTELEDSFGFIFTLMSNFIKFYTEGKEEYESYAEEIFEDFINPFADEFLNAIYIHEKSNLYKSIVNLMSSFFEFERVYYGADERESSRDIKVEHGLSRAESARRESNKKRRNKGVTNGF